MRKVVVDEFMSLDGVVQAPGLPDEDTSGGFEHGGWLGGYFDDLSRRWVIENLTKASGFLLGRRTYETFAAYWPTAGEEEPVLAKHLNTKPKYVASTTLVEPLGWQNSTLLRGDLADAVAALKQGGGDEVHVIGSSQLVRTLIEHELIDEFHLMISPVVLGGGKRIFTADGTRRPLRLLSSQATTTGAILAIYAQDKALGVLGPTLSRRAEGIGA